MFWKYYTADFMKDGEITKSIMLRVSIFTSPWDAWDEIKEFAERKGGKSSNFRRVT